MESITIIFSANDSFAMLLGVILCSIFENKKGDYGINVYVIDGGISEKNKERLGVLENRYGFKINYIIPDKKIFDDVLSAGSEIKLPIETYYRAAVGSMIPQSCRKVLYLDIDAVVRGDIKELFDVSLDGKTIGAVADCFPNDRREHLKELCAEIPSSKILPDTFYFNAGVLSIDLDRWRERGVEEKLFKFMRERSGKLFYHDQDALNVVLLGDCKILPVKYNMIAELAGNYDEKNPLVVHYGGGGKPWYILSALPYRQDYIYYANKTPWKNIKYRKLMDVHFAKRYHIYTLTWGIWTMYKKFKKLFGK